MHFGSQIALYILIHWICSFERPDDDSIKVETYRLRNVLCTKLLCLTEIYTLYELGKHFGMTNVKLIGCRTV